MTIRQRQIVEVAFRLPPDGELLNHPCIVISNDEINEEEQGFVAVMMTSESHYKDDRYSFQLTDNMLAKPLGKSFCAARLHLIGNFLYSDVIVNRNSGNEMKIDAFNRLIVHINKITFDLNLSR